MLQFQLPSVLLALLLALVAAAAATAAKHAKARKAPYPPGPWRLPVVGNIHNLLGKELPHNQLADLARKHGPLMYLRLGQIPTVVVSSPRLAAAFLKTHDRTFADRAALFSSVTVYNCRDVACSPYGEYWRTMKKICVLELLSAKRIASFKHIRVQEACKILESISLAAAQGVVVNLSEELFALSSRIVSRAACGTSQDEQQLRSLVETFDELVRQGSGMDLGDMFPSLGGLIRAINGSGHRFIQAFRKMDSMLEKVITEHMAKSAFSSTDGANKATDILDLLLQHHQHQDLGFLFSISDVKAVLVDIFIAGTDTSASTVEWAMSELMRNPNAMNKLQSELRQAFEDKGNMDETTVGELHYLKLVIKETLRLHPPLPLLIPRESRESCQIDGYDIPAKTRVIINAWALGRDPDDWDKPNDFNPDRFRDSLKDFKGSYFEFIPFGAGRRMCPGVGFGLATVELALAQLVCHFDWKLVDGVTPESLNMDGSYGATMHRMVPLCLVAKAHVSVPCG